MSFSLRSLVRFAMAVSCGALLGAPAAFAQTKWDMPTPYPQTNFHTENIAQFAKDVEAATGGKLEITLHPNGSLFKANEIKRAVQGGQAQIGEMIISGYANEDAFFAMDTVPFLATSYADARQPARSDAESASSRASTSRGCASSSRWRGRRRGSTRRSRSSVADLKGEDTSYSPTPRGSTELAGAQPVTIQAAELAQALATGA